MDNNTKEQFKNIENKKGVKEEEEKDSECFLKYSKLDGRHSPDEISNMLQDIGILNVTCPVCDKTYRKAKWRRNRAGCSECRKEHIVCDECFEDIASKLPYPELPIAQSSDPVPITKEDTTEEKQNLVTFKDDFEQKVLAYGVDFHDETYDHAFQSGSELSSYLNRPVEILKFPWTVGTDFASFRVPPWHLYMTNARIEEKLGTFKLLSATLRIKFMLNGSPFHSGRVLVGMRPTRFTNNTHNILPEATATVSNYLHNGSAVSWTPQKTFYSQRPHILLNPSKNIPMEIHWPFMSNLDWINVPDQDDYRRLGYLEIWVLNTLRMANGGTDPVVITAYAWLENVKLTGATDVLPQGGPLLPVAQMAKKKKKKTSPDEFASDGVISYPASILEGMATKLTDTPVIGKWARATAIGAGAVKNIASLFGFSNPAIIDKQCLMMQNQFGRMCQTSGEDPVVKLSLDPKNELCIDPGTVGLSSDDEMSFMNIAQREGLIYTIPWSTTGDQSDGHLFGTRVSPSVAPIVGISVPGQGATLHEWMTPVKFIAAPFRYWTGSLVYRIQVVCSQMHRGRLGIVYTPDIGGLAGATAGYNQAEHFTYILDISNETDISFEVKWSQPMAWATTELRPSFADIVSGNSVTLAGEFNHNGRLDIYIITDLGAPVASSEQVVDVNVYLRAGDSFQVGVPGETLPLASYSANGVSYDLPTTIPTAQMGELLPLAQSDGAYNLGEEEDDPNQTQVYTLNGLAPLDNTMALHVYFGEDVRSIRNMIKRYCAYDSVPKFVDSPNTGSTCSSSLLLRNFPTGRAAGNVPYGSSGLNAVQNNDVWNTYLRYYAQAYVAFRGSIRWKCALQYSVNFSYNIRACRRSLLARDNALRQSAITSANNFLDTHSLLMGGGGAFSLANSHFENTAGIIVQPSTNTNTISYEVPWYHPTRYGEIHSDDLSTTVFPTPYNSMFQTHTIASRYVTSSNSAAFTNSFLDLYCAAGEDAAFFFFIGAPALFALQPIAPE